jgi:hypothetical protein
MRYQTRRGKDQVARSDFEHDALANTPGKIYMVGVPSRAELSGGRLG